MPHALLAPSSSERWINCPPSAKENAASDTSSSYAQQGTDAHALCEYKVKKALGYKVRDPTPDLEYFDEEMAECTDAYCEFIMEQVQAAKETCPDPQVLVEQRLDFSRWVKDSFGTADCVCVADGTLTVVDFKYGLGVLVEAEGNSQMRMYALGGELPPIDYDTLRMQVESAVQLQAAASMPVQMQSSPVPAAPVVNVPAPEFSGDFIVPVSIGGQHLETVIIKAAQAANARSGGRTI